MLPFRPADARAARRDFRFRRKPRGDESAPVDASTGLIATRILAAVAYLSRMPKSAFAPCLPTRGTKVPDRPEWIHEIKHDGYRLIVQREGQRVRLFTRNGHDWTIGFR